MKLNDLLSRIPFYFEAGKSIYLKSPPGRGKTTTIAEAPKLLGDRLKQRIGLVVINGPLLTPQDAIGYLIPKHTEKGAESLYTDPFWFKTPEGERLDSFDGAIVFVDEADKCDTDVKKVIGEAALSGRLGPHRLPKRTVVWMAGNRSEDRSGSTKELDHLINRRMELDITDDLKSWQDWASAHGCSPIALAFASQNPHIVFPDKTPDKQGPFCTPRSLVSADEYVRTVMQVSGATELPDDPLVTEEVTGMIGPGAAAQFFAFVKLEREMPKFEKIVSEPDKAKVPTKPDAQMLVCYNLAHRVTAKEMDPVIKYIDRLPKDFAVTFASAACKRDVKLVNTPGLQKWAMANASLMAVVTAHAK